MIQLIRNCYDEFLLEYIGVFPPTGQRWLLRRSHGVRQVARKLNLLIVLFENQVDSETERGSEILQHLGFLKEDRRPSLNRHWHLHDRETFEEWFGDLGIPNSLNVRRGKPSFRTRVRRLLPW